MINKVNTDSTYKKKHNMLLVKQFSYIRSIFLSKENFFTMLKNNSQILHNCEIQ